MQRDLISLLSQLRNIVGQKLFILANSCLTLLFTRKASFHFKLDGSENKMDILVISIKDVGKENY